MSQDDMVVANGSGATVRADINSNLQALASLSKGNSRPSTAYAGQLWIDDNTPSSSVWTLNSYDGSNDIPLALIDTTNNRVKWLDYQATDVASAGTVDLDAITGAFCDITGTTAITAITLTQGRIVKVRATGAFTLTHGSSLICPTSADIVCAAGDTFEVWGYSGSVVRIMNYQRLDGTALGGGLFKVGSFTRDTSTASGNQAVTGVGFKPKAVVFLANQSTSKEVSFGFSDGSTHESIYQTSTAGTFGANATAITDDEASGSTSYTGTVNSLDTDGFTVAWTKTGSPTGTLTVYYLALR